MPVLRSISQLPMFSLLIGLLLGLLTASCSQPQPAAADILRSGFSELRSSAEAVIADDYRRETYLELSRQLESELLAFDDYATGFIDGYRESFTDHAVSQSILRERSEAFRTRQRTMQNRFVGLHLAMAATVTTQEWQLLSQHEAKIIQGLLNSAQPGTR